MQIRSVGFGARSAESNCRPVFFGKKHPISKKNRSNRSPEEGDIADLSDDEQLMVDNQTQTEIFWVRSTTLRVLET
ncbi:hypothetical protein SB773_31055, partial [Bacillus sp. SIMBA_074]|uniref:hypothetical protein n=1 Tax=Bacillus sp. SIMBA_074 TaxID=3085812 RepID=UPI00397872A3